ncbi:MAG: hypothetical protein AABW51_04490 [Nanoarchaeota archaeon]
MALQTITSNKKTLKKVSLAGVVESIEVDGTLCGNRGRDGERYLVRINGADVHLTGKSFKYFTKLAWFRKHKKDGWIYREDIEMGYNQARYLYRMKGELASTIGDSWLVTENNRLGYYRLLAKPKIITINMENIANHDDFDVRNLLISQS